MAGHPDQAEVVYNTHPEPLRPAFGHGVRRPRATCMASISYNGQSFAIDGRRIWLLGATLYYTRIHPAHWADRIAAARQAGFNTIETACPWLAHEPRRGRFHFEQETDLKHFIKLCGHAGMRVILRVGPFVGGTFDAGGLPGWLIELSGVEVREDNDLFLEHVSRYFGRLLAEIAPLQATSGGPVLLIQCEHAWDCANDQQGQAYLGEITRFIRENGITVPIINANDLWQEPPDTISTWRGWDDLLVHLRQLRSVHPNAPRLVSAFEAGGVDTWGSPATAGQKTPQLVLAHLAEILAAGAQPIVSPLHAGTNFGFVGGRIAGQANGFVTTAAGTAPIGEDGSRGATYHAIRRLITFANQFGHVFADIDPDYNPIVLDTASVGLNNSVAAISGGRGESPKRGGAAVVALRGAQGRIVFVFAHPSTRHASLVLEDGLRLPVDLGDQTVGWYVLGVDLRGRGRLEYANVCPWAIVADSIVVFHGPERSHVYMSIDGTPLEATIPAGNARPLVLEHEDLTLVICNQTQIDATYHDERAVFVGVSGLDSAGQPVPAAGFSTAWRIAAKAAIEDLKFGSRSAPTTRSTSSRPSVMKPAQWQAVDTLGHVSGQSPRFASLEGPQTLVNCGANTGYGWYRVRMPRAAGRTHLTHLPQASDRVHVYVGQRLVRLLGAGPGARRGPFELKLSHDDPVFVALVDNLGRFAEGNHIGTPRGLYGHVYAVRPIRSAKPKVDQARPVNPFALRGYIAGRTAGQLSDSRQVIWTFQHARKTPMIIEVINAAATGTFVLNDEPVAYCAGATGDLHESILIDPQTRGYKRGRNVLRFAPDARTDGQCEEIAKRTTLYDCIDALSGPAQWAFAKWEPPAMSMYVDVDAAAMKKLKGAPCWWRGEAVVEEFAADHRGLWLDTAGLSKGQAFFNGQNLGRYFTATADGRAVGPQTRLLIPEPWVRHGQVNEIVLFDEHGAAPSRVRLLRQPPTLSMS
jgi:hypothetical protein